MGFEAINCASHSISGLLQCSAQRCCYFLFFLVGMQVRIAFEACNFGPKKMKTTCELNRKSSCKNVWLANKLMSVSFAFEFGIIKESWKGKKQAHRSNRIIT